jgi:hypothetical protein
MVYAMNKVPIAEQIEALEGCLSMGPSTFEPYIGLPGYMAINAALSTLKWVERHQAELRVLGEFPIEKIEVLTPHSTAVSAIGQGADEVKVLREFARDIIADYCWGYSREPDGGDVQELAEKLGLIVPHIATAEDAEDQAEFEPGDTIYKFADWLVEPRGLSAAEEPVAQAVNSQSGGEE